LLQLRGVNISGELNSIMQELLLLHRYGLKQLDLSRNYLTGPVPASLEQLENLEVLLLGSNSECLQDSLQEKLAGQLA
jgi:23S rRNA A1618 N6-methylase RlmF